MYSIVEVKKDNNKGETMNEDNVKEMDIDPKKCIKACRALAGAFDWGETKEGGNYWDAIHKRLIEIAKLIEEE